MDIQVDTQPRIDTLVTGAVSGEQRRRTEYIGTVWIDGRASGDQGAILETAASFVDDPSGAPAWVHLQLQAFSSWPCAIAYRIVAVTPTGAIAV